MKFMLPFAALMIASASFAVAEDKAPAGPTTKPTPVNKFCPVMLEDEIDPDVTVDYKGQTIAFCCSSCVKKFNADPEKYVAKMK